MEEVSLNETETRYYGDLFLCCDEEKCGKIPMLKATELYRSANLPNDKILEIISLSGIPSTALHISRAQFYSCLKLIAAHQAGMLPLRQELIAASVQLPLPRFTWHDNSMHHIPPPLSTSITADRRNSLQRHNDWLENPIAISNHHQHSQNQHLDGSGNVGVIINSDVPSTDSEIDQCESSYGAEEDVLALEKDGNSNKIIGYDTVVAQKHVSSTHRRRSGDGGGCSGSPEAWSTNSDSPTPTNSVAERPWVVKESLWHGLLGDEHRQLLGTEEESSDRHSSDDDNETDLEAVYQITQEQREYYYKQFKMVQHDNNGLLSGHVARVFFEKSRIPVEELRHIWQLCDVTRDGALSLTEFIAAMHLVVLRRNNIPLPAVLPNCLHPNILQYGFTGLSQTIPAATVNQEPPEADLLHLDDDDNAENVRGSGGDMGVDDDEDKTDNTIISSAISIGGSVKISSNANNSRLLNDKNMMSVSTLSTSSQTSISSRQSIKPGGVAGASGIAGMNNIQQQNLSSPTAKHAQQRSTSNSPKVIEMLNITPPVPPPPPPPCSILTSTTEIGAAAPASVAITATTSIKNKDRTLWTVETQSNQWTKFTESPISNVSSPGPKPLNFDMQRTAQAVVSDPQILHPVPLRVTPVGGNIVSNSSSSSAAGAAAAVAIIPDKMSSEIIGDNTLINDEHNAKSTSLVVTSAAGGVPSMPSANANAAAELTHYIVCNNTSNGNSNNNGSSNFKNNNSVHYRDTMQNNENLRAIQRPQAKKLPSKSIGAIPPPPQREPSLGNSTVAAAAAAATITLTSNELNIGGCAAVTTTTTTTAAAAATTAATATVGSYMINKKEPPPLPPPRPSHRHHGRSSSLDLNKFKIITNGNQGQEVIAQTSFDLQSSSGFADFAQFSDNINDNSFENSIDTEDSQLQQQQQQLYSLPPQTIYIMHTNNAATTIATITTTASAIEMQPLTRFALQSNQRVSAFEVYRKPTTPRNSLSPQRTAATIDGSDNCGVQAAPQPFGSAGAAAMTILPNAEQYEKRVNAISETLRHVSFKQENINNSNNVDGGGGGGGNSVINMTDVLKHLREQNHLLMRLCNDLSDELLTVHTRKEELRLKLEALGALQPPLPPPPPSQLASATPSISSSSTLAMQQQHIQSIPLLSANLDNAALTSLSIPTTILSQHQGNNIIRTASSISAPVTANVTGGSGSSGVHSNV